MNIPQQSQSFYYTIIETAKDIFNSIQAIPNELDKDQYVREKHPKFMSKFPIVVKYMIFGKFSPSAFQYILEYNQQLTLDHTNNKINNITHDLDPAIIEIWYKTQAEYSRKLYSENGNLSNEKLQKIYDENYSSLKQCYTNTTTDFKTCIEKIKDERTHLLKTFIRKQINRSQ